MIVLVKSSETPSVEVVEEALDNYRSFLKKWHRLQDDADAKNDSDQSAVDQA